MNTIPYEVSIDFPLYQSKQGLYFIGQTPLLGSTTGNAEAVLNNPNSSGRLIYVNAITITNSSTSSLEAEFYLMPTISYGTISSLVSSTNAAIYPSPLPAGTITYFTDTVPSPTIGTSIFTRIVPPQSTLVVDGGQIILGERSSLGVYIGGFAPVPFQAVRFAFGWSEEKICPCNNQSKENM